MKIGEIFMIWHLNIGGNFINLKIKGKMFDLKMREIFGLKIGEIFMTWHLKIGGNLINLKIRGKVFDLKIGAILVTWLLKNRGNFMNLMWKSRGNFTIWKIEENFISRTHSHIIDINSYNENVFVIRIFPISFSVPFIDYCEQHPQFVCTIKAVWRVQIKHN